MEPGSRAAEATGPLDRTMTETESATQCALIAVPRPQTLISRRCRLRIRRPPVLSDGGRQRIAYLHGKLAWENEWGGNCRAK